MGLSSEEVESVKVGLNLFFDISKWLGVRVHQLDFGTPVACAGLVTALNVWLLVHVFA